MRSSLATRTKKPRLTDGREGRASSSGRPIGSGAEEERLLPAYVLEVRQICRRRWGEDQPVGHYLQAMTDTTGMSYSVAKKWWYGLAEPRPPAMKILRGL